jgi:hypothetical protein
MCSAYGEYGLWVLNRCRSAPTSAIMRAATLERELPDVRQPRDFLPSDCPSGHAPAPAVPGTLLHQRYRSLIEIVADQTEYDEKLDPPTPEMTALIHITRMITRLQTNPHRDAIRLSRSYGDDLFVTHLGGATFFIWSAKTSLFWWGPSFRETTLADQRTMRLAGLA